MEARRHRRHGGANIASLRFALERLGVACATHRPTRATIATQPRVILPGVGAAGDAMARLAALGLADVLPHTDAAGARHLPRHAAAVRGQRGGRCDAASAWFPGAWRRMPAARGRPVPHMGWNQLAAWPRASELLAGIDDGEHVYFVHGFAAPPGSSALATATTVASSRRVVAAAQFLGAQFHPERSARARRRLLANFLAARLHAS